MRIGVPALAFTLGLVPAIGWAQCSSTCATCLCTTTLNGNIYCCESAASDSSSFITVHKWKQAVPGVLTLDGTKFMITFDPAAVGFVLTFGSTKIDSSTSLDKLKQIGVSRAYDIQATGAKLD